MTQIVMIKADLFYYKLSQRDNGTQMMSNIMIDADIKA
jgi:hypothetical protein